MYYSYYIEATGVETKIKCAYGNACMHFTEVQAPFWVHTLFICSLKQGQINLAKAQLAG